MNGGYSLFVLRLLPIDVLKELVLLDVRDFDPHFWLKHQHFGNQVSRHLVCVFRPVYVTPDDVLVELLRVWRVEWSEPSDHLSKQNAESPNVDREIASDIQENFWRKILWRPSVRLGLAVVAFTVEA